MLHIWILLFVFIRSWFYLKKCIKTPKYILNNEINIYQTYVVSLIHCFLSIILNFFIYPQGNFENDNDLIDNYALVMSLSYFIYDIYQSTINKSYIHVLHHLIVITPLFFSLYYNKFSNSLTIAIFWGEISNPLYIISYMLRKNKSKYANIVTKLNWLSYILLRIIISPYIIFNTYIHLNYPIRNLYLYSYIFLYSGSIYWAYSNIYVNYIKHHRYHYL